MVAAGFSLRLLRPAKGEAAASIIMASVLCRTQVNYIKNIYFYKQNKPRLFKELGNYFFLYG